MTVQHEGFTLLEVMISLLIITTLLVLALPAFTLVHEEESERVMNEFATVLATGRSAAIRQAQTVTVCPVSAQMRCATDWHSGVMAFLDRDRNRQRGADEDIVAYQAWRELRGTVQWRAFGNRQSLQISAVGALDHQNGTLKWCTPNSTGQTAPRLIVNSAGRIRKAYGTTAACQ